MISPVALFGRAKSGVLPTRPTLAPVHVRLNATGKWEFSGQFLIARFNVCGPVKGSDFDP
jgi:hypothetical protein